MSKEYNDFDKVLENKRNEIINKVNIDEKIKEQVSKEELLEVVEKIDDKQKKVSSKKPIKKEVEEATLEDKRSEIIGKFLENDSTITNVDNSDVSIENTDDKFQENVENISIAMIVLIVVLCLVIGVFVGYTLYSIALSNS